MGEMTFDFDFGEAPFRPVAKQQFEVYFPDGEYVRFAGQADARVDKAGAVAIPINDIEIEERGSIYDRQGAD